MSDICIEGKSVKQTIITNVEAPRLRGVSVKHFIEFCKLQELPEKQILEKSIQTDSEITAPSIKASVEDADLETFIAAGWIRANNIEGITEEQLILCIKQKCLRQENGEKLYLLDEAVKNVAIKMHILEARDRYGHYIETTC